MYLIVIRSIRNKISPRVQCKYFSIKKNESPNVETKSPSDDNKLSESCDNTSNKKYDVSKISKEDMIWRTPWHEKEGEKYDTLRNFYSEDNQTNFLKLLHSEIDLSPSAIKKWWMERKKNREIFMQSYIPERHQTLGNELAAAHFLVHRGGAVKFYNQDKWIKSNKFQQYKLPGKYEPNCILQAIDCTDMNLYYEGLTNLRNLRNVEWLCFNGVEQLDDWYLDRVSCLFGHSLIYLDIRNCPNYTERGLGALYKMNKLKILHIDDMLMRTTFEMTCLMLQEQNQYLDIKVGD